VEAVVRGHQKNELLLWKHANWEGDKLILRVHDDVLSFLNSSLIAVGLTAVDKGSLGNGSDCTGGISEATQLDSMCSCLSFQVPKCLREQMFVCWHLITKK